MLNTTQLKAKITKINRQLIPSLLFLTVTTTASYASINNCDTLVAHPANKDNPADVVGVQWDAIKTSEAINACSQAIQAYPTELRYQFQLARAYAKAGKANDAFAIYQKLSHQGYAAAQANLANQFKFRKDYDKAFEWFQKSALQGNAQGEFELSRMYGAGQGIQKSTRQALEWRHKSANQGYWLAQQSLGNKYLFGDIGVRPSYPEAIKWFKKSAEQGDISSLTSMGLAYGLMGDRQNDYKYTKLAAEKGDAIGQYNLGNIYYLGKGVPQSNEMAFEWFYKSAQQGFLRAQNSVGYMYSNGIVVAKSYPDAAKWYMKSAQQGYDEAQRELARFYLNGFGVQ